MATQPCVPVRSRSLRTGVSLAVASLMAALLLLVTPGFAQAGPRDYVALGDSYSSGVGTGRYYDDGTECLRSPQAYGPLLASSRGLALTLAACSGATTATVTAEQLGSLTGATGLVTMTIGGNDVGFSSVLTECAKPSWWGDCDGAITTARSIATNQLPGRLASLYSQIKSSAPLAKVVISGYPRLFMGEDCNLGTFFSADEMSKLNDSADLLNGVIRAQAQAAGFSYVDAVPSFIGHAVCSDSEWLNGLSFPIVESFHPNAAGQQGYAAIFAPAIGIDPALTSPPVQTSAQRSAPTLPQVSGRSEAVSAPDLGSHQAKAAARAAGVSPAELSQLIQAQRSGASGAELNRLDQQFSQR